MIAYLRQCAECPLATKLFGKAGLLWIGEQYYKPPRDFITEADRLGVSRRIGAIPRQFEIGKLMFRPLR